MDTARSANYGGSLSHALRRRDRVGVLADSLDADARAMEPEVGEAEAATSDLSTPSLDLGTALASRARPEALRFSNEITRQVALFVATYHPAVPLGIALLDFYGREVQSLSETNDVVSIDRAPGGLRGARGPGAPQCR